MVLLTNVVDTIGFFYIMFFFLIVILVIRNSTFQSYSKKFYKTFLSFFNTLPLLNYISFFFSTFMKSVSFLVKNIYLFFKHKK